MARLESPTQLQERVREQTRGYRRLYKRTASTTPVQSAVEAVLIFLALAGSALAVTTWDAIFNDADTLGADDVPTATAPTSSGATGTVRRNPTTSSVEQGTRPVTLAEIEGRYRLVFVLVDGDGCSADPNDNPPIDVAVQILQKDGDNKGRVLISGDEGEYEFAVTSNPDHNPNVLEFGTSADEADGNFYSDGADVNMTLHFDALGCRFAYTGPRIGS